MLIDNDENSCRTIVQNRSRWDIRCEDVLDFDPAEHKQVYDVDLLSGGLPRVKSMATVKRPGSDVERRLLRAAIWLLSAVRPRALLLENVPDLVSSPAFAADRSWIEEHLEHEGYRASWRVLNAADFGVPQFRKQGFLVAVGGPNFEAFSWPVPSGAAAPTVGEVLGDSMAGGGWPGAGAWRERADRPAPALVGGSANRGGADLGPTGSKRAWAQLGVNGGSLGDDVPGVDFPPDGMPKLNVRQAARIQSIPDCWSFHGRKTSVYRQIGHASPPPVTEAVGRSIALALG
jgi:DNA (cytosine-5)-methyltransferase 1